MIDTLIFGPGGGKSFSFLGAVDAAISQKVIELRDVTCFGGTSGGSFVAFLFAVGFTPKEATAFLCTIDFGILFDDFPDPSLLVEKYGLCDGNRIEYVLREILLQRLGQDKITFQELQERTGIDLLVQVTNLTKKEVIVCGPDTTPGFDIVKAIRMSISLPFAFTPVSHDGDLWVDGSFFRSTIPPPSLAKCLSFNVAIDDSTLLQNADEWSNFLDYSYKLIHSFICFDKTKLESPSRNSITLHLPSENAVMFPDQDSIRLLVEDGYQQFSQCWSSAP